MKVPLLDLKPQLDSMRSEIVDAVTGVIDSTQYIQGPAVESFEKSFEKSFAEYSGSKFATGVSSGTDALLVSLMSLNVGPGDFVITSPYTFFATMGVILRVGATPLFVDIEKNSFNIDPILIEQVLKSDVSDRVKAIMPVHLYGQCADMDPIIKLSVKYGIPVVEDAAQAIGSVYPSRLDGEIKWMNAGSMGDAGCFSFFPSKNLGGIGDGGMVISKTEEFSEKLALMRNHGAYPKYYHSLVGGNFRLDPVQAVVLDVKLKYLDKWHRGRQSNARLYDRLINDKKLIGNGILALPYRVYEKYDIDKTQNDHIYNQYILRVKKRDELMQWLIKNGIGCEIYYPVPLHKQDCLDESYKKLEFPNAEKAASETIALPIYPELTDEMQEYVIDKIAEFY